MDAPIVTPPAAVVDPGTNITPPGSASAGATDVRSWPMSTGIDGNLAAAAGTTTLTRDTYYDTITLSGTAKIVTNGWLLHAKVIDLTNAGADAISWSGNAGNNAVAATGGAAPAASTAQVCGIGTVGTAGTNGTTGVGTQATAASSVNPGNGGRSNAGGKGGAGTFAGGASRAGTAITSNYPLGAPRIPPIQINGTSIGRIGGGNAGPGGSSGGGDGTATGGGGGSGSNGGNTLGVYCDELKIGASTTAGAISNKGGKAGNGAQGVLGAGAASGGGGGGAAGGGGFTQIIAGKVTGSAANVVINDGGDGGTGAAGQGTGVAGDGGDGGDGGDIEFFNLTTNTGTHVAGAVGGVHAGAVAGTGGQCRLSL